MKNKFNYNNFLTFTMKTKIRQFAFVVFDKTTIPENIYNEYYKEKFENKLFIFLGEVPNAPSHCVLADLITGKVIGLHHTQNFREATDEEV